MRRMLLSAAIVLLGTAGLVAAQDTDPDVRYLTAHVSGSAYDPLISYHYFTISQTINPVSGKRETKLEAGYNAPVDDLHFRWAAVEDCIVSNNSITVTQNRASFDALVPDLAVCEIVRMEECTWTSIEHEDYGCVARTGPASIEIVGEAINAVSQSSETEVRTETFTPEAWSMRMQCQSGSGWGPDGGGFTFVFGDYVTYVPFEYEGAPGTAEGNYEHRMCRTMTGTKK